MAHSGEAAAKKQKLDTDFDLSSFSDAAAVRGLACDSERLVCLQLPDGLGSVYCHSCFLSFSSSILRYALDATQQEQQQQQEEGILCTVPLPGDSDLSVWQLALGLIYRVDSATVNLGNAQALLLLAHKYDMRTITAEVERFLLGKDAGDSRLGWHLKHTPSAVGSWLSLASKCQLDKLVQLCADYLVKHNLPVDMQLLTSLEPTHAGQLLAAMQQEVSTVGSKLSTVQRQADSTTHKLRLANTRLDALLHHLGLQVEGERAYEDVFGYKCKQCKKAWVSRNKFQTCCEVVTVKVNLDPCHQTYY